MDSNIGGVKEQGNNFTSGSLNDSKEIASDDESFTR